jgi:periplasmic protein TonB
MMKYQLIGLQTSILLHTLIFAIGVGYSHLLVPTSAPIPIEIGILSCPEPAPVKVAQQHRNRIQAVKETIKPAQQPETLSQTAVAESPMVKQEITTQQTVSAPQTMSAPQTGTGTDEPLKGNQTASNGSIVGPAFNADYLHNPKPSYPLLARRLKLEGTVIIRVLVSPKGKAEIVRLGTSAGSNVLDQAALNAVQEWSFVPAQQGGQPVSAWVDVPIRFRLTE